MNIKFGYNSNPSSCELNVDTNSSGVQCTYAMEIQNLAVHGDLPIKLIRGDLTFHVTEGRSAS